MIKIRKATLEDFDAIFALEQIAFGEETEDSLKRALVSRTFVYFVLCDEKEILGYCAINELLGEAEILTIMVSPDYRKLGYGKMMLEKMIEHAKKHGAEKLFLEVSEHNAPAIKLYKSFNFSEIMRRGNYYLYKNGTKADAIIMQKNLI